MAKKTLESNRKRKARDEDVIAISSSQFEDVMKKVGPAARDEATTKKKKKIDGTNTKKNKKTSKNGEGSNRKIAAVEKEKTKKKAAAPVKTPVKKSDKKVRAQRRDEAVKKTKGKVKKVAAAVDGKVKNDNGAALYVFPMACVSRIVKSETCDTRMRAEAMFLVNKASEKFIEILSQGAYACASKGRNKKIEYKHLSSFIPKDKRYEFLTDFVPVKVRAADALKEVPSV